MKNQTYLTFLPSDDGFLYYDGIRFLDDKFPPFEFEIFDFHSLSSWAHRNWLLGFIVGFFYIVVIFGLKFWMANRKPFHLKRELFFWNLALGIFSICGFLRTAPLFFYKLSQTDGFYRSICVLDGYSTSFSFWGSLFVLSKFAELIDTVFIVLRKRPLVALQWYHHYITMAVSWIILPYIEPINLYFVFLNYGVHGLMYPYFALKSLDVKVPRVVAMVITTVQFAQMVTALFAIGCSAFLYYNGTPCYRHPTTLKLSMGVAISFNVLFGNLCYKSVLVPRIGKKSNKLD